MNTYEMGKWNKIAQTPRYLPGFMLYNWILSNFVYLGDVALTRIRWKFTEI